MPSPELRALTVDTVPMYLLERQLLTHEALVDDQEFKVEDWSRRNRNFKVIVPTAKSYLVKQAGNPWEPEMTAGLAAEADLLRTVDRDPHFQALRRFSSTFVDYDAVNHVLVLELLHPATSLTKYHLNAGRIHFPLDSAVTCARVLADFHALGTQAVERGYVAPLASREPFAFNILEYAEGQAREGHRVAAEFHQLLVELNLFSGLSGLRERHAAYREVVHSDVRWDNYLLTHGAAPGNNLNLRLIDWELVRLGDSAWDLACFLAEYARFRAETSNFLARDPSSAEEPEAAFAFTAVHESARAFLAAYARRRRLGARARNELLERVVAYLPFALLVAGFEAIQRQHLLPVSARVALRMAGEAVTQPAASMRAWFGIEMGALS